MIGPAAGGEDFTPAVLCVAQDQCNEFAGRIVGRANVHRRSRARLFRGRTAAEAIENEAGINAKIPTDQSNDNDRADTEAARTPRHSAARRASFAIIFDVATGAEIIRAHLSLAIIKPGKALAVMQAHASTKRG